MRLLDHNSFARIVVPDWGGEETLQIARDILFPHAPVVGVELESRCTGLLVAVPAARRPPALDELSARERVYVVAHLCAVRTDVSRVASWARRTSRRRRGSTTG